MAPIPFILASSDDNLFKVVGAVVVLIFWGISALAKAANKGQPQPSRPKPAQARPTPRPAAQTPQRRPPPLPHPAGQRRQQISVASRMAPAGSVPLPPLSQLARPGTPQPVARAAPVKRPAVASPGTPAPPPKGPDASQLMNSRVASLLRPKTVRAQFILAEVLQPPLALRSRSSF